MPTYHQNTAHTNDRPCYRRPLSTSQKLRKDTVLPTDRTLPNRLRNGNNSGSHLHLNQGGTVFLGEFRMISSGTGTRRPHALLRDFRKSGILGRRWYSRRRYCHRHRSHNFYKVIRSTLRPVPRKCIDSLHAHTLRGIPHTSGILPSRVRTLLRSDSSPDRPCDERTVRRCHSPNSVYYLDIVRTSYTMCCRLQWTGRMPCTDSRRRWGRILPIPIKIGSSFRFHRFQMMAYRWVQGRYHKIPPSLQMSHRREFQMDCI